MFINNNIDNQNLSFPIFDGAKYYNKYKAKHARGEKLNFYEKIYIWSIHNRTRVMFFLLITLLLIFIINQIFFNNYIMNDNIIHGGNTIKSVGKNVLSPVYAFKNFEKDNKLKFIGDLTYITPLTKSIKGINNKLSSINEVQARMQTQYTGLNKATKFGGINPIFDTIYNWLWTNLISSKMALYIAGLLIIYGFGIVFAPLLILFLIVKYLLRMYKQKTSTLTKQPKNKKI